MEGVSIIIPNYNGAKWISDTIDTCLQQNPLLVKEIIIVDDHSSDDSMNVLTQRKEVDQRIKVVSNPRKGANSARNFGFSISKGSYIQFLDADDLLSPKKVENQFKVLKENHEDTIASCGWAHFINNIDEVKFTPSAIWKDYDMPVSWLIDAWTGGGMMVTSCWLCPRHLVERAGLWDESLLKNQDGEFFCRVLLQAHSVKFVEGAKVYYRKPQKNNVSQRISYEAAESLLKSYRSYEINVRKKLNSTEVKQAIATNYLNFIYQTYPRYQNLCKEAFQHINELRLKKWPIVGGNMFRKSSKLLGFKTAIKLKRLLS